VLIDDDPSLNTKSVARFWDISIPTLRRSVRTGGHPPPDYRSGEYAFWKRSTLIRERERRVAETAAKAARLREKQLNSAANARAGRRKQPTETTDTAA
jgi:hypothetical protein